MEVNRRRCEADKGSGVDSCCCNFMNWQCLDLNIGEVGIAGIIEAEIDSILLMTSISALTKALALSCRFTITGDMPEIQIARRVGWKRPAVKYAVAFQPGEESC